MRNRLNNYDLLRILCVFGVILIHISSTYLKYSVNIINSGTSSYYNHPLASSFYNCIGRFSVPIFLMLTGTLLLKKNKNADFKTFYKKSIKKIFIPVLLFSIIYIIYTIKINNFNSMSDYLYSLKLLIVGKPFYHMWYMYMLIPIYIYIPFIIILKNKIGENLFKTISIIYLPIAVICLWTQKTKFEWDFGQAFLYLSYVMIGYIIGNNKKHNKFYTIFFITIGILIELLLTLLVYKATLNGIITDNLEYTIQSNTSPLSVLSAILIFIGFTNINIKIDFSYLSNLTFYIYLFHAGILDIIITQYPKVLTYNSIISTPILMIIIFIISLLLSIVFNSIYNYIIKLIKIHIKLND